MFCSVLVVRSKGTTVKTVFILFLLIFTRTDKVYVHFEEPGIQLPIEAATMPSD